MIQKYFNEKIISSKKINGHFNKNYKVEVKSGFYHLKIFKDKSYEIKSWIEGKTIKKWDDNTIKLVCKEIKSLHQENKNWEKMDYCIKKINDEKYTFLLNKYKNDKLVPCHNDLNKDNIVINKKRAFLIDYEFKRNNNLYWEIANIINEDGLGEDQIRLFLKYYEGLSESKLKDFIYINKTFVNWWKSKFL